MTILHGIQSPEDLKQLSATELEQLCSEIRAFLIEKVSASGGHLGPNLGVVELTVGLHKVFSSPRDPFIFDTSHQSYVHKILTGRHDKFDTLRKKDGLSGYTDRAESEHDWTESSHASMAISYADGLAKAFHITGEKDRKVIAVVGDGAMTGGPCWEALNNVASSEDRNVVVVVNDNGRSYSPTIGGFAENLSQLRMTRGYDKMMEHGKSTLKSLGWVGERSFEALHAFKEGVKSSVLPTEMFPELGMKYVGPVDGHDLNSVISALEYARDYSGPLIVHVVTEKGRGFAPAATESTDLMHSTGVIDPVTGKATSVSGTSWTSVFSDELLKAGQRREDIVAITAAMAGPTGMQPFAENFPDRFFDVGIAEAHAVGSASGLALGGLHPVVAVYSTFLNRAFDQLLMDVALIKQGVTLVLDRAGVTGSDGASHNGVWDMALTSIVPGMRVSAPRDSQQLRELFQEAIEVSDAPTSVRFPKGEVSADIPALHRSSDGVDTLLEDAANDDNLRVYIMAVGATAADVLGAVEDVRTELGDGVSFTVVDPRWVSPIAPSVLDGASNADLVVTVEDGIIRGGIGSQLAEALNSSSVDTPIRYIAFPDVFPKHASRSQLLAEVGLDRAGITASLVEWVNELAG
ncbi:1-deoxy-D-xylulose-5-phosphate synthase [Corynebacterium renale]|uniref:1-deoxy-D-xylulose-5-phosphate synthase n=1 Tax=Corynebacterium renale TaxID=1724 RepID=UPI000DA2F546|nr:1-deoxy-D-xylulose-5-phosphate synthase [Corynebacterium renale]SQG64816.1 1-deoxy-D-xylulose-5-phosphate synthase [Corynebacterium renale]